MSSLANITLPGQNIDKNVNIQIETVTPKTTKTGSTEEIFYDEAYGSVNPNTPLQFRNTESDST